MRLFIISVALLISGSAAPSTLTFTSPDSSKCLLQKNGQSVSSTCDLASCGTSTCQLKSRNTAQDKELAALRDFATNQAAENAALRKLIAALTTGLNSIKVTHDTDHGEQGSALKDLEDAYIAADTQLQASIQTIALTPGKDGADGKDGAQGERGATGATGAQGEQGKTGQTGAAGAKGDKGEQGEQNDQAQWNCAVDVTSADIAKASRAACDSMPKKEGVTYDFTATTICVPRCGFHFGLGRDGKPNWVWPNPCGYSSYCNDGRADVRADMRSCCPKTCGVSSSCPKPWET
jgi:hypothetical protein